MQLCVSNLTIQGEYVLRVDPPEGWSFSKHTFLPLVLIRSYFIHVYMCVPLQYQTRVYMYISRACVYVLHSV